jgi:hypothetical protein
VDCSASLARAPGAGFTFFRPPGLTLPTGRHTRPSSGRLEVDKALYQSPDPRATIGIPSGEDQMRWLDPIPTNCQSLTIKDSARAGKCAQRTREHLTLAAAHLTGRIPKKAAGDHGSEKEKSSRIAPIDSSNASPRKTVLTARWFCRVTFYR